MRKYLFLFLIISGIILPTISFAALPDFNGPFVICGRSSIGQDDCTLCDIFKMAQLIIDLIIGLIIIIGPILIAVGGGMILFAGADPGLLNKGKSVIKNAIIGLIIALLAWTVINMIFNKLANKDAFPWPWNEINCTEGGVTDIPETPETPPVEEGEYCVCKVPVYDLNPSDYPEKAQMFATNVKVTKLATKEECKNNCEVVSGKSYCPGRQPGIKDEEFNFQCVTESYVQETVKLLTDPDFAPASTMNNIGCFATLQECKDATIVNNTNFEKCGRQCYLYGVSWCERGGDNCQKIGTAPCSTSRPYVLRRYKQEIVRDLLSMFNCSQKLETGKSCRIGDTVFSGVTMCTESGENTPQWCQRPAPSGSERWVIYNIKPEQKGDASQRLTDFLNCMYRTTNINSGLTITSISDDKLCSSECTPSTGVGCSHTANSCHYGGSKCGGTSFAVDFASGPNYAKCSDIKTAAKKCDGTAWVNYEGNHIHISVNNVNCGCAETYTPKDCPAGQ